MVFMGDDGGDTLSMALTDGTGDDYSSIRVFRVTPTATQTGVTPRSGAAPRNTID